MDFRVVLCLGVCVACVPLASTATIGELLLRNQTIYSTLDILLTITDLEPAVQSGTYTLFAPTDAAFAKIAGQLPDFDDPNAKATYERILKNHLVAGVYMSSDLKEGQRLQTLAGTTITIHMSPAPRVGNSNIIGIDERASNGVVHTIDSVLLPS